MLRSIRESLSQNPIAWVAFGLFLFAEYNLYQRGTQLHTVCEYFRSLGHMEDFKRNAPAAETICLKTLYPEQFE